MTKMDSVFSRYLTNESGATAIEYGLIAALIGVGLIVGANAMTGSMNTMFSDVDSKMVGAFDSTSPTP